MKMRPAHFLGFFVGCVLVSGCAITSRVTSADSELIVKNVKLSRVFVVVLPVKLNSVDQPLANFTASKWAAGELERAADEVVNVLRQKGITTYPMTAEKLKKSGASGHVLFFSVPRATWVAKRNPYNLANGETVVEYEASLQLIDTFQNRIVWKSRTNMNVGAEDTAKPLAMEFLELLQKDHLI